MNNTRFLPRRWFAPREAAPRRDDLPVTPVRDDIDNFFQNMFNGMVTPWEAMNEFLPFWRHQRAEADILPSLDLTSDEKAYVLSEKKQENRDDKKNQHVLERVYGSFQRVLALPEDADAEAVTATHKNGVLTVTIPRKVPAQSRAKSIEITRE